MSGEASFCPRCGPDSLALIIDQRERTSAKAEPDAVRRLTAALGAQFEVVRLFGRGGFAEVYEVRDTELERRLAVKVLRADMAWTPGMLGRFKQEARAVAQLSHPNTVPIHFVGEGDGLVFYVMPFIEGATLADVLRAHGPLDPERAVSVALPILEALDHAHRNGIVHRDIKPDNVMIEAGSGRPLLVDFGIAKRVTEDGTQTDAHAGLVVGTPLYMSPEQALGHHDVDARADIYAMGALLFQMVTGTPPFDGSTSADIVAKHLTEPVRFPAACAARLPAWLTDAIVKAMAKQPADRYQSAAEMLEPLRQGARRNRAGTLVPPPSITGGINRDDPTLQMDADTLSGGGRRRRRRAVALIALGLAMSGFGAGAVLLGRTAPALVVENGLLDAVAVTVNGDPRVMVGPGDSLRVPLARGEALAAHWQVLRPRDADGDELGEALGGTIADSIPRGNIRHRLDLSALTGNYVVASVSNASSDSLRVTLRDSAGASIDCDCVVPPRAESVPLGYLDARRIAAVTLTDPRGRRVTFDSLVRRARAGTRVVELRVGTDDFGARGSARAARGDGVGPREVISPLPDLKLPLPPPAESAARVDSARTDTTRARRRTDPLAPIFPNRR